MAVEVYAHPDGSYQWVDGTFTDADLQACKAAPNADQWIQQNATVLQPPTSSPS